MKPRVAILGTRGIVYNDSSLAGGFETFAKKLSFRLVERNCADVTVYVPHYIDFDSNEYKGVKLVKIFNPEKKIGKVGNIIYDYLSYKDALKRDFDLIIECGYGSFVPAIYLKNKGRKPYLVVNMDGFEWKRSLFFPVRCFFRFAEKIVANRADILIADHPVIQDYLQEKYKTPVKLLSYGTELNENFDVKFLEKYGLEKNKYFIMVSRPIADNNIKLIFKAFDNLIRTDTLDFKLVWITDTNSKFAKKIIKAYNSRNYVYINSIDENELFSLRHYAAAYIHGHSSGGTNPSLLEAIASKVSIIAHDNIFNRHILQNNATYFTDVKSLRNLLFTKVNNTKVYKSNINNFNEGQFSWNVIVDKYCEFLIQNSL